MEDREIDRLLARIEALAKENQQLSSNKMFHEKRADNLQRTADQAERAQRNLETATKERAEAYAKVREWEQFGETLRDLVPITKRKNWPKQPSVFDDIPF